jgi:hypothetical protein
LTGDCFQGDSVIPDFIEPLLAWAESLQHYLEGKHATSTLITPVQDWR